MIYYNLIKQEQPCQLCSNILLFIKCTDLSDTKQIFTSDFNFLDERVIVKRSFSIQVTLIVLKTQAVAFLLWPFFFGLAILLMVTLSADLFFFGGGGSARLPDLQVILKGESNMKVQKSHFWKFWQISPNSQVTTTLRKQ